MTCEKLASYSLDLDHRDGGHKACVFQAVLGITATDVDYLAYALRDGLVITPVRRVRANPPHGVVCAVSIYEDAALIELSEMPMPEPLDNLVVVPADQLEVTWRIADHSPRGMEA